MVPPVTKTPSETKDYTFLWSNDLGTDVIVSSTWTACSLEDSALDVNDPSPSIDSTATKTTGWLSGGTLGVTYTVTNTITTNAGREFQRSFPCYIQAYNFL